MKLFIFLSALSLAAAGKVDNQEFHSWAESKGILTHVNSMGLNDAQQLQLYAIAQTFELACAELMSNDVGVEVAGNDNAEDDVSSDIDSNGESDIASNKAVNANHAQAAQTNHAQAAQTNHALAAQANHAQAAQTNHAQAAQTNHAQETQANQAQAAQTNHAQEAEHEHLVEHQQHEQTYTTNSGNGDPHFMLTSPKSKEHLCFDANGRAGDKMMLIDDLGTDLYVDGELFEPSTSTDDKRLTFFSHIYINIGNVKVDCNRENLIIDGDVYDWGMANERYDHVTIESTSSNVVYVTLPNDVTLQVTRAVGEAAQGAYLGVFVLRSTGLSDSATGVMGQFLHSEFDLVTSSSYEDGEKAVLQFYDFHGQIPVRSVQRFNGITKERSQCWLYEPAADGLNMLLGDRVNYIYGNTLI